MRVVRQGDCIGQPSRCRGGTCSCCPDCGEHRWNHDKTRCLSAKCSPLPDAAMRERLAAKAHQDKLQAGRDQKLAEMPEWLRTKPSTHAQERQAKVYCEVRGLEYPYPDLPPKKRK